LKFLLTSDWHLDAITAGIKRVEEFDLYFDRLRKSIVMNDIETVLILGDYFDPGTMRAHELTTRLMGIVEDIAGCGRPVVMIAGNHDVVESSGGYTTISPLRFLDPASNGGALVSVVEKPTFLPVMFTGTIGILCLPYVARAAYDPEDLNKAVGDAGRAVKAGKKIGVIGHMSVPGAAIGSETTDMPRGRDIDLPTNLIETLNPVFVANGHYHRAQVVKGKVDVIVPGSPHRLTFGERDDENKGFTIIEVEA
jgi:exonuclease SbcD